jgi:hypothetical protein
MKKIWIFLNTPLVVALISIALVAILLSVSVLRLLFAFDEDDKRRREVEAIGRLQLVSFVEAERIPGLPQRYIGMIRNNSSFIMQSIEAAICVYDADGALIDVLSRALEGVGTLEPGAERAFTVDRVYDWDSRVETDIWVQGASTTMTFVATQTTETKD